MAKRKAPILIPGWKHKLYQLWSIRLSLAWGAICGLYAAWPAFQSVLDPIPFALCSVFMCAAIAGARVLKQKGVD